MMWSMPTGRKSILVSGGAGFIGSHLVESLIHQEWQVVVIDALTYAGRTANLEPYLSQGQMIFVHGRIEDRELVSALFDKYKFDALVNLAAESHVDRSIKKSCAFISSNIVGVHTLLETLRERQDFLPQHFRFIQVSTDEVYGSLGEGDRFTELSPYAPNSPYSASKAAADMLCRAWFHTYGTPVIVTNCSNNYGPRQFPEKLIPLVVRLACQERPLPVYGEGQNIRDWIFVKDHCQGIALALEKGKPGDAYCFGGRAERKNIRVVEDICKYLDEIRPRASGSYADLIEFVKDRPGHDYRYAVDDTKAEKELMFTRQKSFENGLRETIDWYLANPKWLEGTFE